MKRNLAIGIALLILAFGCKKDLPVPPAGNLISNPSFDSAGHPSLQGWTGNGYSFVNDVPPGGGPWSLQLQPQWMFEGYAETYVTGFSGNCNFKLTCYAKAYSNGNFSGYGTISLRLKKQNIPWISLVTDSVLNSNWQNYSLTANVSLQPTDEIIVHLSAGRTELINWVALFNRVYLQKQ